MDDIGIGLTKGLDKMVTILQLTFSNVFFKRKLGILIDIWHKFIPRGPVQKVALVVVWF